jgi:hypothetical protein
MGVSRDPSPYMGRSHATPVLTWQVLLHACMHCRQSKTACTDNRPCLRCSRLGVSLPPILGQGTRDTCHIRVLPHLHTTHLLQVPHILHLPHLRTYRTCYTYAPSAISIQLLCEPYMDKPRKRACVGCNANKVSKLYCCSKCGQLVKYIHSR